MSTLEKLRGYMYSFQKLSQFSQGRNVVDSSASNTEYSAERYICFFPSAEDDYL
jgi:hypothetical protein